METLGMMVEINKFLKNLLQLSIYWILFLIASSPITTRFDLSVVELLYVSFIPAIFLGMLNAIYAELIKLNSKIAPTQSDDKQSKKLLMD